jgi:hypothetical protein
VFDVKSSGIYRIDEVSEGLDVCKATVYNFINKDGLKSTRIRGKTYIRGSDLLDFLFKEKK